MHVFWRATAGLAAIVALSAGAWLALFSTFGWSAAWERPDPSVPDGDPCCGHPDDWEDVATSVAGGLVMLGLAMAMCVAAVALARRAFFDERLRRRWFLIAPAVVVVVVAALCAAAIARNA